MPSWRRQTDNLRLLTIFREELDHVRALFAPWCRAVFKRELEMRTAVRPGIRLDYLLAREITIQWAEAVALVQATCRQIIVTAASGFPSTAQIMLYEEGAVVALATVGQPQVPAAAQLLASVLRADVPVRLRLLASQATGADGPYANLHAFSEALASFERPDPPDLLRALYRRAGAAPARAGTTMAPPLAVSTRPAAKARRGRAWVIVTAAVVTVALVAMWFIERVSAG